jgi:hypothetical protein
MTAQVEAVAHGTQTQRSIGITDTAVSNIAEDQVDLTAYYFCSSVLDLEEKNIRDSINERLSMRDLQLGKLMITPYWNRMYGTTDREFLFVILANSGTVLLKPEDATDILWEPNDYAPEGWLDIDTVRNNGTIKAGTAHALLIADRITGLSIPFLPTDPCAPPGDPSQLDPAIISTPSGSDLFFRCLYPSNWRVTKIEFKLAYTSEGSSTPRLETVTLSEELGSIEEFFDPQ